ncbi:hypothetical protein PROFUN_04458 [Planoprotostelium fungivorum]|uniref:Uncharacterized protein n=1 Tax=Planoprotostelium fungivorum TaxID=1890364 RepID=A0A2P6NVR2_9EUKA|nr:hypothetical protein PROFUN_04458 [Planoprotostelium fungivorum]
MHNTGHSTIRLPSLTTKLPDLSMMKCEDLPTTPTHIKKHRQQLSPGRSVVHPGRADDPQPRSPDFTFGNRTKYSESVEQVVYPRSTKLVTEEIARKEEIYNRSPLGRAKKSAAAAPPQEGPFGIRTQFGEGVDTSLRYEEKDVPQEVIERSLRHHNNYESGQQRKLNYDWTSSGIDVKNHSFGKSNAMEKAGVSDCLDWYENEELDEERKRALRRPTGSKDVVNKHSNSVVYGMHTGGYDNISDIIHGGYSQSSSTDDRLGRTNTPGLMNTANGARQDGTAFGISTYKNNNSFTLKPNSPPNRRTDPYAKTEAFTQGRGNYEEDWVKPRTEEELFDIVRSAGVLQDEQLHREILRALKENGSIVNVHNYQKALSVWHEKELHVLTFEI